jgi:lipopolysaccharide biosynthesis glycosyltransferase
MVLFTSISLNYLPKARVLAYSIKKCHPDWIIHLIISDCVFGEYGQNIKSDNEPFDKIVWVHELNIGNIYSWIFKHTVVELCTAVKGIYIQQLFNEGFEKIIYLDPDIVVINSINYISELLEDHAILLTPHLLEYSTDKQAINDNEIMGVLRHGVYNLGFIAINCKKPDGKRFANWWANRLLEYCYDDYSNGLFTDQKWCDIIPAYFNDYYIIRDPGYNVASWNINKRKLSFSDEGDLLVNNKYLLRFYHFTGYDSGTGNSMINRYGDGNQVINEIWAWYERMLQQNGQGEFGKHKYGYNYYDNGFEITKENRQIYREREDLQKLFPNPFSTKDGENKYKGGFYSWLNSNG